MRTQHPAREGTNDAGRKDATAEYMSKLHLLASKRGLSMNQKRRKLQQTGGFLPALLAPLAASVVMPLLRQRFAWQHMKRKGEQRGTRGTRGPATVMAEIVDGEDQGDQSGPEGPATVMAEIVAKKEARGTRGPATVKAEIVDKRGPEWTGGYRY